MAEKPQLSPQAVTQVGRISAYRSDGFKISGQWHVGALMLTPGQVLAWEDPGLDVVRVVDAANALGAIYPAMELLLIGTGQKMIRMPALALPFSVDAMDSAAVCRTFGVLLAEGREVGALLLPVSA